MIEEQDLEHLLLHFAKELAEIATWPDGSLFGDDIFALIVGPNAPRALNLARVYPSLTGPKLRRALAQQGALGVDGDSEVTAAVAGFFDLWARLLTAFARPAAREDAEPRVVTVAAQAPRKLRDTIFEGNAGRLGDLAARIGEKTGGQDLSPGQPTSTAQYQPQMAGEAAPMSPAERAALAGYPFSTPERDVAETLARLGGAPEMAPAQKLRVPYRDDGKDRHGSVFISRPARLAAKAPPALRAASDDAGPEVSSPATSADEE